MTILHLDSGRQMRGGQWQVLRLHRGLAADTEVRQTALARGPLRNRLRCPRLTPAAVFRAALGVDLIHAHDARSHSLAAALGRGRPLVVSRRVAFDIRPGALSRWKYARADRYLAVSEFVAERLRAAGVAGSRIQVVYDGVDLPADEPAFEAPAPKPLIGALDSPDPLKGAALARAACDAAGLPLALDADLDQLLSRCDVFLYLSHNEGLGSALLRAMARKRPIIASRIGGIPELVEHGKTGLLCPNEPQPIADALAQLVAEPQAAQVRAEAAYARAAETFRSDIMVARTQEVYRSVLHG